MQLQQYNMRRTFCVWQISLLLILNMLSYSLCAMTYQQLIKSYDMFKNMCAPKFQLSDETLNNLRKGVFVEEQELKCYTLCIAQMAGTITKKNEISLEKTLKQIDSMFPKDLAPLVVDATHKCKDVQKQYKDLCDKVFYSVVCHKSQLGDKFLFP